MFWSRKKETPPPAATPPPIPLGKGNPGIFDEPKNDLERALLAVRNREIPTQKFLEYFLNSQLFVAVPEGQTQKDGDQGKLISNPTLFTITYPEYTALCFYTHESRLKPTSEQFPDFRYAVSLLAGDFILGAAGSFGVVINPYWDVNLEWSSSQIDRLKQMIKG
jgi:hypothetical protein